MTNKFALCLIFLAAITNVQFFGVALAQTVVGVQEGDWIEYQVTCIGQVPEKHDVNSAKIEVTDVAGATVDIKLTSMYVSGAEETDEATLNLRTGQLGDAFIIPANLSEGNTFLEQTEGNITISREEQKTYAGAKRTVVTATTTYSTFYWDKATGFLVEATSTYTNFTITTKAQETNIWQTEPYTIDPIISIVVIAILIGAVSALFLKDRDKKNSALFLVI